MGISWVMNREGKGAYLSLISRAIASAMEFMKIRVTDKHELGNETQINLTSGKRWIKKEYELNWPRRVPYISMPSRGS
jgi:hypothetical protein